MRISKWNVRSGRTVTRTGRGVPTVTCCVRALNSFVSHRNVRYTEILCEHDRVRGGSWLTLQKSIDLIPLLPNAGPTGGLGLACPAPTMSRTTWSTGPRAFDILECAALHIPLPRCCRTNVSLLVDGPIERTWLFAALIEILGPEIQSQSFPCGWCGYQPQFL